MIKNDGGSIKRIFSIDCSNLYASFLLAIFAAVIRIFNLERPALNDEAFNAWVSEAGILTSIERIADDAFPPFYNAVLSLWIQLFGNNIETLRIPSVIAGSLAVVTVFLTARQIGGVRTAWLAGLIFAVMPVQVYWSQIARPYGVFMIFSGLYILGTVKAVQEISSKRPNKAVSGPSVAATTAILIGGSGAVLSHHVALLLIGCGNLFLLLTKYEDLRNIRSFLGRWVIIQACIALIWIIDLPILFRQSESVAQRPEAETYSPGPTEILSYIFSHLGGFHLWRLLPFAIALFAALLVYGAWRHRKHRIFWSFGISYFAIPLLFCLILNATFHGVFGRAIWSSLWIEVAVAIGFAMALSEIRIRWIAVAALLLCFGFLARASQNVLLVPHPDWGGALEVVSKRASSEDWIVLHPAELKYSLHYARMRIASASQYGVIGKDGSIRQLEKKAGSVEIPKSIYVLGSSVLPPDEPLVVGGLHYCAVESGTAAERVQFQRFILDGLSSCIVR